MPAQSIGDFYLSALFHIVLTIILKGRKLTLLEVEPQAQGHRADPWQSCGFNLGLRLQELVSFLWTPRATSAGVALSYWGASPAPPLLLLNPTTGHPIFHSAHLFSPHPKSYPTLTPPLKWFVPALNPSTPSPPIILHPVLWEPPPLAWKQGRNTGSWKMSCWFST